eukprot:7132267-Alexandrium_andersonii.AAC.1
MRLWGDEGGRSPLCSWLAQGPPPNCAGVALLTRRGEAGAGPKSAQTRVCWRQVPKCTAAAMAVQCAPCRGAPMLQLFSVHLCTLRQ